MKLPGFPIPEPGETVASVVARQLARTAGPRSRTLNFLALRHTAAHTLIPPQLIEFAESMPHGHPWESNPQEIIAKHSLVPLYLYFANLTRRESVFASLQAGLSSNPAASLGLTINANRRMSASYKFCSDCVANDLNGLGFAIAYREHQPAFVRVCVEHGTPLLFDCSNCRINRKSLGIWRMAGQCDCSEPKNVPAHTRSEDLISESGFIWLAQQVRTILRHETTGHELSPTKRLRVSLIANGFGRGTKLNPGAILDAIVHRYGRHLLNELDIPSSVSNSRGSNWPNRLLGLPATNGERTPNVLLSLLLTGLVAPDVKSLNKQVFNAITLAARVPAGYSTQRIIERQILSKESIEIALNECKGKVSAAAARLKVSTSQLAVDMQRHNMRLLLTGAAIKRLGYEKIESVREALRRGTPKIEIQRSIGISEWSLQLIELDCPELRDIHRESTIKRQRDEHRKTWLLYRSSNPTAGRSQVRKECAAAFDWLSSFDVEWLTSNLSALQYRGKNGRGPRKDWPKIDQGYVDNIRQAVKEELAKEEIPRRLTATFLLSTAGALARPPHLVPLARAEATRYAESEDIYLRRRIKWAVVEYSKRKEAISINKLRRVASLHPHKLIHYQQYITEIAVELGVTIDARCALSPFRN